MRRMTALIGFALLLPAACGQAERAYTPGEAATASAAASPARPAPTGTAPATPTTAATPASGPGAIVMGGGKFQVRIDWPAKPDPLLRLVTGYLVATRKALVAGDDRYLQDLDLELSAAPLAYDWVHGYLEKEQTVRGVTRLYNLRVAAKVGNGVQVNACVDETGARVVSARTGKAVSPRPQWVLAPYLQAVIAHRGDDDVWRIRDIRYDLKGCPG
ncbi:hypothetical protein MF672_046835 [Actinomadura sp. ATCC 31491]|uniref:Lipoprotein n=1 Tax=Actinomadura luzonensis TaxID=2805427 RepID=A0ABT0G9K7_9ACTN|nr:hypothetical protein [Actinomadura luzonensis]MCK2221271.1 hypothetical protein [Actinomadura luzonensis]